MQTTTTKASEIPRDIMRVDYGFSLAEDSSAWEQIGNADGIGEDDFPKTDKGAMLVEFRLVPDGNTPCNLSLDAIRAYTEKLGAGWRLGEARDLLSLAEAKPMVQGLVFVPTVVVNENVAVCLMTFDDGSKHLLGYSDEEGILQEQDVQATCSGGNKIRFLIVRDLQLGTKS